MTNELRLRVLVRIIDLQAVAIPELLDHTLAVRRFGIFDDRSSRPGCHIGWLGCVFSQVHRVSLTGRIDPADW
jgi:hypothetical protein